MSAPPDPPRIAIVAAIREELDAIRTRARDVRPQKSFLVGRIGAADIVLAMTGDGFLRASESAAALCEAFRPTALIGAGVAGALSRNLSAGDLLVARRVRDSTGEAPLPDPLLLARAVAIGGAAAGTLITVARPAVAASEKASLAASLNGNGPAAVDMESAAWARAAAGSGVPYLIVRSISDGMSEELPDYLARCVGEDGRMRRAAVVGYSILRPRTIPALIAMRRRIVLCGERLALFIERFLAERL